MVCVMCKGDLTEGTISYSADHNSQFLLIRKVPALICSQCGEFFLDDETLARIEQVIESAKKTNVEIEVLKFAA